MFVAQTRSSSPAHQINQAPKFVRHRHRFAMQSLRLIVRSDLQTKLEGHEFAIAALFELDAARIHCQSQGTEPKPYIPCKSIRLQTWLIAFTT
jgi:hypothetical protein